MSTPGSGRSSGSNHLEIKRQVFHLALLSLWAVPIVYAPTWLTLTLMVLVVLINTLVVFKVKPLLKVFAFLIDHLERERNLDRPGIQSLYANIGVLTAYIVFGKIALYGVLVLAVGDSLSTLVGKTFGRSPIFFNTSKSWEGTVAFFLGTYTVLSLLIEFRDALLISSICSLIEAVRIKIDDNLLLPLAGSFLAYLIW